MMVEEAGEDDPSWRLQDTGAVWQPLQSSLSSQLENRTHTLARSATVLSYLTKVVCKRMGAASYLCTKYSSHTLCWPNTVPGSFSPRGITDHSNLDVVEFTSEILLTASSSLSPVLTKTAGRSTETVWRGRGVLEGREYKAKHNL